VWHTVLIGRDGLELLDFISEDFCSYSAKRHFLCMGNYSCVVQQGTTAVNSDDASTSLLFADHGVVVGSCEDVAPPPHLLQDPDQDGMHACALVESPSVDARSEVLPPSLSGLRKQELGTVLCNVELVGQHECLPQSSGNMQSETEWQAEEDVKEETCKSGKAVQVQAGKVKEGQTLTASLPVSLGSEKPVAPIIRRSLVYDPDHVGAKTHASLPVLNKNTSQEDLPTNAKMAEEQELQNVQVERQHREEAAPEPSDNKNIDDDLHSADGSTAAGTASASSASAETDVERRKSEKREKKLRESQIARKAFAKAATQTRNMKCLQKEMRLLGTTTGAAVELLRGGDPRANCRGK